MISGMVGGIFAGVAPAQPVPWRLLRLADAREQAWDGAAKVQTESQDADGWITLGLRNNAPAADFPSKMAFHSFPFLNPDGSPVDTATLAPGRVIVFLLQRDTTAWPGSVAQETVAIGTVDRDGDIADAAAAGVLVGIRTTSASTSCSLISGTPTTASATAAAASRAYGALVVTPTQAGAMLTVAMTEDGTRVAGNLAASLSTPVGARRIVLVAGCNSSTDNGPHPVRFRAWYALLASDGYPWSDPT
jgi:hypothetical protein